MAKAVKNKGIRIIAGQWRGRRLPVLDLPGLRPTGDRAKETLFNWLQADIRGSRCLDLFAGSGALGFEAASRGASKVLLLEKQVQAARLLQQNIELLAADNLQIEQVDTLVWLAQEQTGSFDIVFLDPPFASAWQAAVLQKIAGNQLVQSGSLVYVESAAKAPCIEVTAAFQELKMKCMGEIRMQLFKII